MSFKDHVKEELNKAIVRLDLTDITRESLETVPVYDLFLNSILSKKQRENIDPDILLAAMTETYIQFIMSIKVVNDHKNGHDVDHNLQLENILHDLNVGVLLSPSIYEQHSLIFDELCLLEINAPLLSFESVSKLIRAAIASYGYNANCYRNGDPIEAGEIPYSMLTVDSLSITDMVHSLLITVMVLSQLLRGAQDIH
ncbi:hypothetical protein [Aliivibrio fischeri]|uniref:hypothetical protein n=1 Tax=Aliivibrio fischeri TaxID=668 RepID=UPI0012D9ED2E|nr:hypothetical protein [Aliivibrio fischeri]MUJ20343.1 hypothetical protein [Aliivibrio fischeri]